MCHNTNQVFLRICGNGYSYVTWVWTIIAYQNSVEKTAILVFLAMAEQHVKDVGENGEGGEGSVQKA